MDKTSQEEMLLQEQSLEIADKVRTGEYFREARAMYDQAVHDPMTERYLYIIVTLLAAFILLVSYIAMNGLYPLKTDVPFAVESNDLVNELPHIKPLLEYKGEDTNEALLRFLVRNYVKAYEEYNIDTFDRDLGTIKSQSSDDVFAEYQKLIDPKSADSPLTLYQRHSKRKITILSSSRSGEGGNGMEVIFEAAVIGRTDIKKTHWQANITFNYSPVELDEKTGKVIPFKFMVTHYRNKRLQDIR